jgi:hypothetical protein
VQEKTVENFCRNFFVMEPSRRRNTSLQITAPLRPNGALASSNGEYKMTIRNLALTAACFLSLTAAAQAACVVHYNRTACPGKEAESYSKCGGSKECDKEDSAAVSLKACGQSAAAACANTRLTITKSKVITAKFNGTALRGGSNFCASNRPDFNKCAK